MQAAPDVPRNAGLRHQCVVASAAKRCARPQPRRRRSSRSAEWLDTAQVHQKVCSHGSTQSNTFSPPQHWSYTGHPPRLHSFLPQPACNAVPIEDGSGHLSWLSLKGGAAAAAAVVVAERRKKEKRKKCSRLSVGGFAATHHFHPSAYAQGTRHDGHSAKDL